ncbi:N-6 DNA methylase [Kribbella sp. WER1]
MNEVTSWLSLTDIARHTGVRVSAVSNWRKRHGDFPASSIVSGQEMFAAPQVAQWLRTRRIPQNRLEASETPGTTYSDRFLRNIDDAGMRETVDSGGDAQPVEQSWSTQLWRAFDGLRGEFNRAAALEVLLGLAYVKTQRTELWQDLTDPDRWREAWRTLPQEPLPLRTVTGEVRVFRDLPADPDPSAFETIRLIDAVDFDDSSGTVSTGARVADAILADLERGMGRGSAQFTPPDVARSLVALLDLTPEDRIYDPFCGSGELLSAAVAYLDAHRHPVEDLDVCGQASHDWSLRTSAMNLALHGIDADLRKGNALEIDRFPALQFSKVLANPPFNMRNDVPASGRWRFGQPPAHNANFAWLQHVISKLTPDGHGAVVMPGSAASTLSHNEGHIRAAMVSAGVVECVIALPARLFKFTGIPTMVWVLRGIEHSAVRQDILFVDARQLGEPVDRSRRHLTADDTERIVSEYQRWKIAANSEDFKSTAGFSRSVSYREIEANDFVLAPSRYLTPADGTLDEDRVSAQLVALRSKLPALRTVASRLETASDTELSKLVADHHSGHEGEIVRLGTICDIVSGPGSIARSDPQPSWTPLVLPRNIRRGAIGSEDVDSVPPQMAARLARYRLRAGDIVSARAGTLGRFGLVHEDQTGWLLGPGCVMLRPMTRSSSEYLTYYLSSPAAQRWLMDQTSGSVIRHVNTKTLGGLPVWLPSPRLQDRIVKTLKAFDNAAEAYRELSEASREIHDLAVSVLISPGTTAPAASGRPTE